MRFIKSSLDGVLLLEPQPILDERGFFERTFCKRELLENGVDFDCVQCNISHNSKKNTLRGLHYQREPHTEAKIVSCISGAIFDVAVDLREDSATYLKWEGFLLTAENARSLYIPRGFAHGFVTLTDDADVYYQMSEYYVKGYEAGIRFDDPAVGVEWPVEGEYIISERDLDFPPLQRKI